VAKAITSSSWRQFAEQELEKAKQDGVSIITADSPDYPERLRNTPDPPLFLYVKGNLDQGDSIAVVGTRKPTAYGMSVAKRIAAELAEAGLTIVSGLARGIDTQAHRGALKAKGRTIAVLGSGIDVAYPPENRELMREITQAGAVVSENPFGTQPEAGYFPARNRIISGLSRGTVIVEAAVDSGSLITAQYALEQNRKLFAIPGNIASPNSRGTHSLIRQGALLVEGGSDILRELGVATSCGERKQVRRSLPVLDTDEQAVLRCIQNDPKHIDRIMKESGLTAGKLSAVLITLELKGLVSQVPGKQYVRSDEVEALEA
jgi:DNA processing protein